MAAQDLSGSMFEDEDKRAGFHEAVVDGDEPFAGIQVLAINLKFGFEKAQFAARALEPPDGAEDEFGGEIAGGIRLPDDFVDGVALADGVHHLANEQRKAALFIGFERGGDRDVIVKIFEEFLLGERRGIRGRREFRRR